jgi:DNA-binding transcriptional regulator YhcF (GntR family)
MRRTTTLPIRIHNQGDLPIYVQIKHQLSYLITTNQLPGSTRLPTVRALAADLNINPDTVNQAYRELQSEGLIESFAGRGSFVRRFGDVTVAEQARLAKLTGVLRDARRRAASLGFGDLEIARHLASLASHEEARCHVLFVDRAPHIAHKYAARLEHHLGERVAARAATPEDLAAPDEPTARCLLDAHFLVTFARHVPQIERWLEATGADHEIITIVSAVVPETVRTLGRLPAAARVVVLTEERYVHAALNLVATYSEIDPNVVPVFTPADAAGFRAAAARADVALYTFGASGALEETDLLIPCFELVFDISPDSVRQLRRTLGIEPAR